MEIDDILEAGEVQPLTWDSTQGVHTSTLRKISAYRRVIRILAGFTGCLLVSVVILSVVVAVQHKDSKNSDNSDPVPDSDNGGLDPSLIAFRKELSVNVSAAMDTSVSPCEDFYQFACGGWIKSNKLEPDETRKVRGFDVIEDANRQVLSSIIRERWPLLNEFYQSCMDEATRNSDTSIQAVLSLLQVNGINDIFKTAGTLHVAGVSTLFDFGIQPAPRNPDVYVATLNQGGLGVPTRNFYLTQGTEAEELRKKYKEHIQTMLEFTGLDTATSSLMSVEVLNFEVEIAKASLPLAELRDPNGTCNMYTLTKLSQDFPLPWSDFFVALGIKEERFTGEDINVIAPKYFQQLSTLLANTDPATVEAYFRWQVAHDLSAYLAPKYGEETFNFFDKVLSGMDERAPLEERCVEMTDQLLGDLLGHYFVMETFPPSTREIARDLIARIEEAFKETVETDNAWLDDYTRKASLDKLSKVRNKVGYPDDWQDYSSLRMNSLNFFDNSRSSLDMAFSKQLKRFNERQAVVKSDWDMTTPTVNAYYNPPGNEMVFPAGILRATFFDERYPAPMNFGGIGLVMGHELTHGFDDEGRNYDGTGNLTVWWSDKAINSFKDRAQCLVNQYSGYTVGGKNVNGNQTLGENIADNGGVRLAYKAFKRYQAEQAQKGIKEPPLLPTLTDDQLFFVGFAQGWCELIRPEAAQQRLELDVHSPARYRVQGPLTNFEEFSRAFKCSAGSPYSPETRCRVW
eukprot:TRINITY_DN1653_c0_g1::TRINITY_DN1653_c0_g1_i1::g.17860::m.17860 TRINITY_DN1653_c0_g1::TRINITY_DN1653_c0_g1_i1::g.17860  ORF type:complete len:741 (-),score=172.88,sp/Q4PZA2/ECE1_MOUSE/34.97/2e-126,Peptidase_M13_N/PF05649.8/4.3e-80,Peptidase_M13/PF01431.16/2.6e-65 TRINITY_DN1653_c0_g1_i1:396-2618(-)